MRATPIHTVLIVDDDEDILETLAACLDNHPYDVLTAKTSAGAVSILENREIAVLLCDLHMSDGMDGNDILAAARAANGDIVSILMSGRMDQEALVTALNQGGISRYLDKPLHMEEVCSVVEEGITRYIRNSRPQERLQKLARKMTVKMNTTNASEPAQIQSLDRPIRKSARRKLEDAFAGGRYKLMAVVGDGATGTVYRAQDQLLHMVVALKILRPQLTTDDNEIAILKEEARIAMTLSHRNIVRLHHFEALKGQYFLVMEYVEGCSFRDALLEDGAFSTKSAVLIMQSCASALAYAHEHGVIHQDLKPENLLLTENGMVKIIDFGVACLIGRKQHTDLIAGTPIYMSPEQKRGENVDIRTDVYSMGIIFYELLTGQPPFASDLDPMDILRRNPDPLTGLTDAMTPVLEKALAPAPADRWASMSEFANAFINAVAASK